MNNNQEELRKINPKQQPEIQIPQQINEGVFTKLIRKVYKRLNPGKKKFL